MKVLICMLAFLLSDTCIINRDGSVTLPDMVCDQPYTAQLSTSYTYSNIPPGLTLNPTTGVLSGTVKCADIGMPNTSDATMTLTMTYSPKGK